jgi:signal transduction histidine kinase
MLNTVSLATSIVRINFIMYTRLTILNKGLLLIAIPLLLQTVFVVLLVQTQLEAVRAQQWAVHTKEVMARVEDIYRRLLEGYASIRILVVSDDPALSRPFQRTIDVIPNQVADLRVLTSDNKSQQPWIDQIAEKSSGIIGWLAAEERRLHTGERSKAIDELGTGAKLLGELRATTDEILQEEARLDSFRMSRLQRSMSRQLGILVVGGIALVGTTLGLGFVFLNGVIKRLAVLRDNARRFGAGRPLSTLLTGHDEIAEVDRAFHEMASSLDQQKQENEMFVYSVSHDLRSPLINLQGFSEELSLSYRDMERLLRHEQIPPAIRDDGLKLMSENIEDSIRYIQTAVGRLARIIDALLRLSRAGRVEYQLQKVDVAALVEKIIDALHDTIAGKKAEINVGDLSTAWGDPTAVEQIFANLIGNAVHYLDPSRSGRIEVGCSEPSRSDGLAGFRVYYVKDNGLGIPAAYHQRVFTAFSRLQANVKQGEGIGLALVRRMVERHAGKIWLESAAGVGTTFFVALPAEPQSATVLDSVQQPSASETVARRTA